MAPTANRDLTPRSVKIGYSKKVWWLCSEGHEWQATIKGRLKRNDCSICEKEEIKKESTSFIGIPTFSKNFRENRRFKTKAIAVIEIPKSGHWVYAEMTDFSSNGLRLETEAAINPGAVLKIKFDKLLVSSRLDKSPISSNNGNGQYKIYNSKVKWCKKLDTDKSISNYGIGVQLF
jgi:hypothetical protein